MYVFLGVWDWLKRWLKWGWVLMKVMDGEYYL